MAVGLGGDSFTENIKVLVPFFSVLNLKRIYVCYKNVVRVFFSHVKQIEINRFRLTGNSENK